MAPSGAYLVKVVSFGLFFYAPATFEHMVNLLLQGSMWCLCYLDDATVFLSAFEHPY